MPILANESCSILKIAAKYFQKDHPEPKILSFGDIYDSERFSLQIHTEAYLNSGHTICAQSQLFTNFPKLPFQSSIVSRHYTPPVSSPIHRIHQFLLNNTVPASSHCHPSSFSRKFYPGSLSSPSSLILKYLSYFYFHPTSLLFHSRTNSVKSHWFSL